MAASCHLWSLRICPRHPRRCRRSVLRESIQVSVCERHHGTLTPPWFSPSCVQKYHCAATDHSCTRKQSGLTDRSALPSFLMIFALSADGTPRHRVVPEECICSFQGSEIRSCLAPDMYQFSRGRSKIAGTGNGDLLLDLQIREVHDDCGSDRKGELESK